MDDSVVWRDGADMYSLCHHRYFYNGSGTFQLMICFSIASFGSLANIYDCSFLILLQVRPAVSHGLGLQGSLKDGPWSYRICSIVIMTPIYSTLLVLVGTVFGRHHYFRHFSVKMFSRFGIPPEMLDANFHHTKNHFRKY